ncbi:ABC transporter permease [Leucobacter allii]|uniref:ABC transporter permease n=1 Tax=Leucobacter allii TaxID=2932247 RepID=A0ABY4FJN9_9MICO|nr:ABC transporter permease [Leucobacter allii]UOQ56371.1 ABC transporter permease [Leucobacter allii]
MSDTTAPAVERTPILRTSIIAAALTGIIAIIVLAFSWPAVTAEPKDVAIAVVGPEQAATAIADQLEENSDGVYDITVIDDRTAAVEGIEKRDYFGAIILGEQPELLTASANGTINQVITQLEEPLQTALTAQAQATTEAAGVDAPEVSLTVTDVAPLSEGDPNGSLLSSAFFPMLFGGILGGVLITTLIKGTSRRVLAVGVYAIVGGVVLASILQLWFGSIQGDYLVNVGAFSLAVAAIAAPIVGLVALLGQSGTFVGLATMMLFANPISGSALPAQFLPGAWGQVGQWFPPGASATLIRELSYFPNADMSFPWIVLAGWVAGGLILTLIGRAVRRPKTQPEAETTPAQEQLVGA